jgi:hypothetical protein
MITLETTGDAFGPSFSGRCKNSSPESESGGPVPVESDHMSANSEDHQKCYKSNTLDIVLTSLVITSVLYIKEVIITLLLSLQL